MSTSHYFVSYINSYFILIIITNNANLSFFSVPNPVVTPLQTNSPCPDVDSSNKLSSYFQTPEVTSTPMEMDDDYNQNQIFDMNDLDDIDDDIDDDYEEDEEDTDDSMSGQDHLASKLLETMQNLKKAI
ncbi:hypothetical protein QTN25_004672 [Entamoeba marina]